MLKISNLSIGNSGAAILENINAELESSKLTCLVGKNGTGKSTLIRTLSGFQKPIGGKVCINRDTDLFSLSVKRLSKFISVVLTDKPVFDNLTVLDVVSLGRSPFNGIFGSLSHRDIESVNNALYLTGTYRLQNRRINDLSDGERQKVMIAKAIAQETPLILLDEPSAFLDYESKNELMILLSKLAHENGKSILVSSHDLDIVRKTADVFWIIENGVLHVSGELPF